MKIKTPKTPKAPSVSEELDPRQRLFEFYFPELSKLAAQRMSEQA